MNPQIIVDVFYHMKDPSKTVIKTNVRSEKVEEVLSAWFYTQMGEGSDSRKPFEQEVFRITIGLDLSDDSFITQSDTNNASLTCGIMLNLMANLKTITIQPLS